MVELRNAATSDHKAIISLNETEVQQTSPMNLDRLKALIETAAYCKVAVVDGRVAAFLLALRNGAPYENDNYSWFASRLPSFLYVDRVIVSPEFAGRKIGSKLYDDLFAFARQTGLKTITCEYNITPPNPASKAFHDKFGFRELGTQWIAGGTKQVSLQAAET